MPDNLILSNDSRNNAQLTFVSLLRLEEPLLARFSGVVNDSDDSKVSGTAEISAGCMIYPEVTIVNCIEDQWWVGRFITIEFKEGNPNIFRVPMLRFYYRVENDNSIEDANSSETYCIFLTSLTLDE